MNKIKKIFISCGVCFTSMVSKVLAFEFEPSMIVEEKYGVIDPRMYETKYGIYEPTIWERFLKQYENIEEIIPIGIMIKTINKIISHPISRPTILLTDNFISFYLLNICMYLL